MGLLAAGLAHDFKNLLTIISGNLEMLALDRREPREQRKLVAEAWRTTDLMGQLTTNLLAFVRQGNIDCVPTDVSLLTASTARLLARLLDNGASLETKIDEGLIATINPAHFQTVVINLVLNARDAMPGGGCVTMRLEETHIDVEAARGTGLKAGRYIAVSVSDTGTGMPTEALYRAFDSFYTTKPAGIGLGLTSVEQFAANVGGAVRIDSRLDRGTTVDLLIPRRPKNAIATRKSSLVAAN
jgi:two-component system CheB/CheR fusion protein